MIINTIRYLAAGDRTWHAWRLGSGTGRFRNYQCLTAPAPILRQVLAAIGYVLTGKIDGQITEAALQLADDAGNTWTVHRRAGQARFLKNGEALSDTDSERILLASLLDLDQHITADGSASTLPSPDLGIFTLSCDSKDGSLKLSRFGSSEDPQDSIRDIISRQIEEVSQACAHALAQPALATPQTLLKLARALEPIAAQYRELCDQYRETQNDQEGISEEDLTAIEHLATEVELLAEIDETAAPLLKPGVSLKALRDEQLRTDSEIAELCTQCGIENAESAPLTRDLRKPVEALARLEAYAKLIRASQGARKYCEQNIDPLYKKYLSSIESNIANDQHIVAELESCLATLSLRLRNERLQGGARSTADSAGAMAGTTIKGWFERFKAKAPASEHQPVNLAEDPERLHAAPRAQQDNEDTPRLAVEYALSRLSELAGGLDFARVGYDSALSRIDAAHEELVKNYGRLKDHWAAVAKSSGLPEDIDLPKLLNLVGNYARLVALLEHRQELQSRIRKYQARIAKLEKLVLDWRNTTGSQKTTTLANTQLLLQEARDILRYRDTKIKRLQQLRVTSSEAKARLALRTMLKNRRRALLAAWHKAFAEAQLPALDINHEALPELFRRAGLIRALAIVHSSVDKRTPAAASLLDAQDCERFAANIYLWEDSKTDNHRRLELLKGLEEAKGRELRLLLFADEALAAMLGSLGVGLATKVAIAPVVPPKARSDIPASVTPRARPDARAVIQNRKTGPAKVEREDRSGQGHQQYGSSPQRSAADMLNERARQALEILSNKKP